ncbi:MAG TPA: YeeE/YedE family protein [Nocardioidaceae bacterium]|nr:YeeE/YedE family protein [Nocardioidaceae bacterium]
MASSTATQPDVRPEPRVAPPAPAPSPVQRGVALAGLAAAILLTFVTYSTQGPDKAVLLVLGLGLGLALFHSRFGFTSAWRQLVAVGQGKALRAHTLLLAATAIVFAPFLAAGVSPTGQAVEGNLSPIGVSLLVGATIFGVGMQIGGACASGTLYIVGSGHTAIFLTLGGFVVGSTIGAAHFAWWEATPSVEAISLAEVFGSTAAGLAVTLAALALIAGMTYVVARAKNPPPVGAVPTAPGFARVFRGAWPLWVGALALALLNLGVLFFKGSPWGVTSAFALWGSKAAAGLGLADPASWDYFAGDKAAALDESLLADSTSLTNFGIIIGALIASALAGAFSLHRRVPARMAAGAIIGGILMGYGARLAYGCNIGAYLGGISSLSLHGWVWGVMAILGTWIGLRARPLFGLSRPKPTDGVC